jgi:hypothetical protein
VSSCQRPPLGTSLATADENSIASFMHYTLILSPKGQYLLKLLGNANRLVPYVVIRQTLKIGNVASMISAMMKVILAKMSLSTITNWIGLTQGEDQGLNLMQQYGLGSCSMFKRDKLTYRRIISTVLSWEISDLEKRASKIEKDQAGPSKDQIECIKAYSNKSLEEQELFRTQSRTLFPSPANASSDMW